MSTARASLSRKARLSRWCDSLNRIVTVLGCEVFTDEASNVILRGETPKARKAYDVLKAYGKTDGKSELCFENGVSWIFIR